MKRKPSTIPVEVQPPNKTSRRRVVGTAPDNLQASEVAERVGISSDCLLSGRILKSKGYRRWNLVVLTAIRNV